MNVPFEEIKANLDRSWSLRLMDLIENPETDESIAADAVDALSDLVDPRNTERLFTLATDTNLHADVRKRALEVICDSGLSLEGSELRAWWESGDDLLQKEALEDALHEQSDYLRGVLSDPLHPLYLYAVKALEQDFDEPEWQTFAVQALSHFDAEVREVAAQLVVWHEPKAAEPVLIKMAQTDEPDCAYEAIKTLRFFGSRTALRALTELLDHPDSDCAEAAREAVEVMTSDFTSEFAEFKPGTGGYPFSKKWLEPIADVLALYAIESDVHDRFTSSHEKSFVSGADLIRVGSFEDLDGHWQPKLDLLRKFNWSQLPKNDWTPLRTVLINHPDLIVRRDACSAFAHREDVDALIELTNDKYEIVRMQAFFELQNVPANALIADELHKRLLEDDVADRMVDEIFVAWTHHSEVVPPEELIVIALHDTRLSLRWHAINQLDSVDVDELLPILDAPPTNNWKLHAMVLDKFVSEERYPPNFERFAEVDDIDVATSYASLLELP